MPVAAGAGPYVARGAPLSAGEAAKALVALVVSLVAARDALRANGDDTADPAIGDALVEALWRVAGAPPRAESGALGTLALIGAARRDAVDAPARIRLLTKVAQVKPGGDGGGALAAAADGGADAAARAPPAAGSDWELAQCGALLIARCAPPHDGALEAQILLYCRGSNNVIFQRLK